MAARTILVVDDDNDAVAFVQAVLEPIGMKVISAENGEKGLALAKSALPDLVILDVFMPGKLGFYCFPDFKSCEETKNIPIIILTSLTSRIGMSCTPVNIWESFGVRPDELLDKPVEPGKLQSVVRKLLHEEPGVQEE